MMGRGFTSTFAIDGAVDWLKNPYAFDQAVKAANRVLEALRPHGQMKPAGGEMKLAGGRCPVVNSRIRFRTFGVRFADVILKEAATGESVSANNWLRNRVHCAQVIGRVIDDDSKGVYLPRQGLVGHGKEFREQ